MFCDIYLPDMKKHTTKKKTSSRKKMLGRYKSSLELTCSNALKANKIPFKYEEDLFTLQNSFTFPHTYFKMTPKSKVLTDRSNKLIQSIKYTPDFVGEGWIIEVKGYLPSHHDFSMRWKLFLKHIIDNNLGYSVFLVKNQTQVNHAIREIIKLNENEK